MILIELSTMVKMAMVLFHGAIYPERHLEGVLREVLGSDTKTLDPSYATTIGVKIGIAVTTVSNNPTTKLFTDYNGIGEKRDRLGMY